MKHTEFICDLTNHVLAVPLLAVETNNFDWLLNAFNLVISTATPFYFVTGDNSSHSSTKINNNLETSNPAQKYPEPFEQGNTTFLK